MLEPFRPRESLRSAPPRWGRGWPPTRVALLAAALAAVLGAALPRAAHAQAPSARVEVSDLEFEGNAVFPDDSLRFAIINRETQCRPVLQYTPFCWLRLGFANEKEYLIRRELDRDVTRLRIYYSERGYREALVDTAVAYDPEKSATSITFQIREGEPVLIDSLAFVGTDVLGEGQLLRNLPVAAGDPLSVIKLEAARDSIVRRLRNEGYVHAEVFLQRFIPLDRPLAAQVTYDIDPGPRAQIGEITIQVSGPAQISDQVVRDMLPFREGSLYSEADMQQGQRNLYNLELVQNALITLDTIRMQTAPDSLVPLSIVVSTSTLHRVRVGAGWNQADCMSAEARWANRNMFGGAQVFQVTGRLSNLLAENLQDVACQHAGVDEFGGINWSLAAELNFPSIISPRNSLGLSLFWERQSLPDVFIREAVGVNVVVSRIFRPRTPLSVYYRPQRTQLEAAGVFYCTSLLVCSPEDIAVLEDPNWLAPVGVAMTRDRTDDLLNPSQGYAAHVELEHASQLTISDFAYTRLTGDMSRYWGLARRTVFAARLRAGVVGAAEFGGVESFGVDVVPPERRFFAGGANSVRGFAQNGLGPRVLTVENADLLGPVQVSAGDTILLGPCTPEQIVLFTCDADSLDDDDFFPRPTGGTRLLEGNVEYRFAVSTAFQGVGFVDFGQVWTEQDDFGLGDLEWTPGIGARYFSPIGPLRVDIAYRFRGAEFLPVVTSRIRPFGPGDEGSDRICLDLDAASLESADLTCPGVGQVRIPWVPRDELALLAPTVRFGEGDGFFNRLQIHLSIGQAF